jgi:two-component system invasion response regulator UvrY
MVAVLIVDDHDLIRFSIKTLLAAQRNVTIVGEATSGEQAVQLARSLKPQVVLLDLQMPGIGGMEAARKLLQLNPAPKVIVLTANEEAVLSHHLIRVGVQGFLTKQATIDEIIKAIYQVAAGKNYITSHIAQQMALHQIGRTEQSPLTNLSGREVQVMWMIAQGQTVKSVSQKLFISIKTVNTYRYRLFEKLGVHNDVELTHLGYHFGLLEQAPLTQHIS